MKRQACLVLLAVFLNLAASAVCAQTGVVSAAVTRRVVLPNGVHLVLKPEPETERVALALFVRMEAEPSPMSAAVGEMVARTLFYGNVNRTQNGIQALAAEAGGSVDVLRAPEFVAVTYVTTPAQLPEAAHLLCDCLKNAEFAPESLRLARQQLLTERRLRHQEAFAAGYDALCSLLGRSQPDENALSRVTQAQAQDYFRRRYIPGHTVISLAGRFDSARVQGLFAAFLADYNRVTPRRPFLEPEFTPADTAQNPLVLTAPGTSAYALVGTEAPSVRSPDYPAFTVLQTLLGGGHACRLFRQARETLGLGYEVGALYQADRREPLVAYLQWNPGRAPSTTAPNTTPASVQKLLETQLDGILTTPPTEEEVSRARNVAIGQDALRHERARDRAFLGGWYETMGPGFGYDAEFPRLLAAVTRADILRVARAYLKTRAVVMALPQVETAAKPHE